jgi:hypothetical protein
MEKVVGRKEPAGIKRFFGFSFAHLTCLLVEKKGEGFVVFLNHCGGNLTTIIITIKDFYVEQGFNFIFQPVLNLPFISMYLDSKSLHVNVFFP